MAKKKRVVKQSSPTKNKGVRPVNATSDKVRNPNNGLWGLTLFQLIGIVLGITLIAFLPVFSAEFIIWDDPEYTFDNYLLKDFDYAKVFSTSTFHMGNYHPLTLTWYYWESKLFGFNSSAFHANNLLLHLVNVLLVFVIVRKLAPKASLFIPAFTAVLFGIHPMHVESVAWVSELKDVLYALFFLGAIWQYLLYLENKKWLHLILVIICFFLSLLSKGQAVVLPVVLVLIDLYKRRKFTIVSIVEKVPLFALSIYFGLLAIDAQSAESAINKDYQGSDVLFYGSYGVVFYLQKLFLPLSLSGAHPYPFNPVFESMPGSFKIMPAIVLAVIVLVFLNGRKRSYMWMGLAFFLICISIVLKLIPVGDTIVAERYTYIPYIGLFFLIAYWLDEMQKNAKYREGIKIGSIAVVALLTLMSYSRTQVWQTNEKFWTDVSTKYPNYWRSYNNLAEELEKKEEFKNALTMYRLAGEKDKYAPPIPYLKQGVILLNEFKDREGAVNAFRRATEFPNKSDEAHYNARMNLSQALVLLNRSRESIENLEGLETNFPNSPDIFYRRAIAYANVRSFDTCMANFQRAIEMSPDRWEYYLRRGIVYTDIMGSHELGIADFNKVLELNPGHKDAQINIGVAYYKSGRNKDAIEVYSNVLKQDPTNARIFMLRALAYAGDAQYRNAYEDAQKAISGGAQLDPALVDAWRVNAGV